MTAVVDDPLIAGMVIRRVLPLHESSRRLRRLYPECPRVYGVAVMSDVSQTALVAVGGRIDQRIGWTPCSPTRPRRWTAAAAAAQQLAATLAHVVIGRVVALVVLEGRAWDTGLENLWVHVDSEGAIDWVGVVDPTLRVLPDDPLRRCGRGGTPGWMVALPSEAALATWVAHRVPPRAGTAVRQLPRQRRRGQRGDDVAHRRVLPSSCAATQVPLLAGSSEVPACAAGRRCSTRWSDSGCRCAASSTRADGAGIQFGRITEKVLLN